MKTQNEMRGEFEKLPHISLVIGFLKFSEDSNDYIRIDDRIDSYALSLVNGAWYAFQEQQKKIDEALNFYNTAKSDVNIGMMQIAIYLKGNKND